MLIGTMEGISAGSQIGTGQPHEAQPCSVCSSPYRRHIRLNSQIPHGVFGIVDQMQTGLDLLFHVFILILNLKNRCALPVLFIYGFLNESQKLFPHLKALSVVIPDNIVQLSLLHVSLHRGKMEKSLIHFCVGRRVAGGKHLVDLHRYQRRVYHLILGVAGMNIDSVNLKGG